jgi:hypothetical protein
MEKKQRLVAALHCLEEEQPEEFHWIKTYAPWIDWKLMDEIERGRFFALWLDALQSATSEPPVYPEEFFTLSGCTPEDLTGDDRVRHCLTQIFRNKGEIEPSIRGPHSRAIYKDFNNQLLRLLTNHSTPSELAELLEVILGIRYPTSILRKCLPVLPLPILKPALDYHSPNKQNQEDLNAIEAWMQKKAPPPPRRQPPARPHPSIMQSERPRPLPPSRPAPRKPLLQ